MSKRAEVKPELGTAAPAADDRALQAEQAAETLGEAPVVVRRMQFAPLHPQLPETPVANLELLMDVGVRVAVELGRASMSIHEVLSLTRGSVVELDKLAGEAVDIYVNDTMIAHGEVVVVGEKFGVRITEVLARTRAPNLATVQ